VIAKVIINMNMQYTPSVASLNQPRAYLDKEVVILSAWIQGRVSTKAQVSGKVMQNGEYLNVDKASLEEQKEKCLNTIITFKGNCPVCYRELRLSLVGESFAKGESGRNQVREDTEEILSAADNGLFKVLVTIDNDRLARKRATAVYLRDRLKSKGVQIYSLSQAVPLRCSDCFDPLDDDTGTIVETLSDMKAQLDLSKIRRNYKIGMPKRIENGKPSGSLAYGLVKTYKSTGKDWRGNDVLEEIYKWDTKKTDNVKRIVNEYLNGKGVWKICQDLNLESIPSPQNKVWGRSAVLCILKNPTYSGKVRLGWKPFKNGKRKIQPIERWHIHDAQFKGIYSWEKYWEIQNEMKRKATIGGRAVSSNALLIGLLKCGRCKYSMFQARGGKILLNGNPYEWKGYACGTFMHRGTCHHNGIKQEVLDKLVLQEVLKLANEKTRETFFEELSKDKKLNYEDEIRRVELKQRGLLNQFDRVNKAYKEGIDTLEEYAKKKGELLPQIEDAKNNLIVLKSKVQNNRNVTWQDEYQKTIQNFLNIPTLEHKRKVKLILNKLIDRVEFRKKPKSVRIYYKLD
jgi:site-specific DNA recombinase